MVTYHYVKFYVSIIIQLEVININVRNFNFPNILKSIERLKLKIEKNKITNNNTSIKREFRVNYELY
jgi:hypothetical protein